MAADPIAMPVDRVDKWSVLSDIRRLTCTIGNQVWADTYGDQANAKAKARL